MKLYIARHGNALSKQEDQARPLSETGKTEVNRMASFLARAGVRVGRVLHSGKTRAAQTAAIYAGVIGNRVMTEEVDNLTPNSDPAAVAAAVDGFDTDVLIAGHLPHLGRLVSLLTSGDANRPIVSLATGAVVCLERGDNGDGWYMLWMVDPALLG